MQSCYKSNPSDSVNLPVVESYLVPGNPLTVKLYQQKNVSDTAKYGPPITGQQVYISDGTTKVQLMESPAGTYTYNNTNFLVTGKTYSLQFNYLGSAVTAQTVVPTKPQGFTEVNTTVRFVSANPGGLVDTINVLRWNSRPDTLNYVLVFENADGTASPVLGGFGAENNRPANFEVNTNGAQVYYLTTRTFNYYGPYSIILLHANQEYINLLSSNTSGSTSGNLLNAATNINNGLGIFTAFQADTLYMNVYY